jgi:hypothetical protein
MFSRALPQEELVGHQPTALNSPQQFENRRYFWLRLLCLHETRVEIGARRPANGATARQQYVRKLTQGFTNAGCSAELISLLS